MFHLIDTAPSEKDSLVDFSQDFSGEHGYETIIQMPLSETLQSDHHKITVRPVATMRRRKETMDVK